MQNQKPATQGSSQIDQKEKKIYELYASSGKANNGMAPIGTPFTSQQSQNQGNQNSFLQNKYQFATYYGQKPSYPSPATQNNTMPQNQMVIMGGQYEYNIESGQNQAAPTQQKQPNLTKQNPQQA